MQNRTPQLSLIAATLLALSAIAAPARADDRPDSRSEWRHDSREIRQDRRELRGDYRELANDRADFRRAEAAGNGAGMRRERAEIRQDKQEIRRDQAELRHDLRDRRQDVRSHHDQGRDWGEQHAVRHDLREEAVQGRRAQAANWQAPRHQQASSAAVSQSATERQNNGRHLGWQQGRGNPQRS